MMGIFFTSFIFFVLYFILSFFSYSKCLNTYRDLLVNQYNNHLPESAFVFIWFSSTTFSETAWFRCHLLVLLVHCIINQSQQQLTLSLSNAVLIETVIMTANCKTQLIYLIKIYIISSNMVHQSLYFTTYTLNTIHELKVLCFFVCVCVCLCVCVSAHMHIIRGI